MRHHSIGPANIRGCGTRVNMSCKRSCLRPQSSLNVGEAFLSFKTKLGRLLRPDDNNVYLFLGFGAVLSVALTSWAKGTTLRKINPYEVVIEFDRAYSVRKGTALRMNGVEIGSVSRTAVAQSLDHVEVYVEVNDARSVIPKHSRIELNQTGPMVPEPQLDVVPALPVKPHTHGPLSKHCYEEDAIVCTGEHVPGYHGGSTDEMTAIALKNMRHSVIKVREEW